MDMRMKVNNVSRLIVGFVIIILFYISFGIFALTTIGNLSDLTTTIYNHPLVVSNASLQANTAITKMHRTMKDVVLFEAESDIQRFIEAVTIEEQNVYDQLDIVKSKILGEEGKRLENVARIQFTNWRSIRNEVTELVQAGQKMQAAEITIGKGADHVALLEAHMQGLTRYARDKATNFMEEKDREYQRSRRILIFVLFSSIAASTLISFLIMRQTIAYEVQLKANEKRYRTLFKSSSDAIFLVDVETLQLMDANEAAIDLYGYPYDTLVQMKATDLSAEKEKTKDAIQKSHDKSIPLRYHKKQDGSVFPVEITANLLQVENKEINISSIRDISDRVASENRIRNSLSEKEILLREIHHRVKNNMQIVQSLISLQLNQLADDKLKKPLVDSANRIKSMALIHETLYQSKDISKLDIQAYYHQIADHLLRIYKRPGLDVSKAFYIEPLTFDIDRSIASGLVLNELISNALKYAYPDKDKGRLTIALKELDDHWAELVIRDDGCGLPDHIRIEKTDSLGLKIVRILVDGQLKGKIHVDRSNGTVFTIQFPIHG